MTRYPILTGLSPAIVIGLITAIVNLLNAFGWVTITPEQLNSINTLATTLLVVLGIGGVAYGQNKSTPVDDARIPEGTQITVVTPKGEEDKQVTV